MYIGFDEPVDSLEPIASISTKVSTTPVDPTVPTNEHVEDGFVAKDGRATMSKLRRTTMRAYHSGILVVVKHRETVFGSDVLVVSEEPIAHIPAKVSVALVVPAPSGDDEPMKDGPVPKDDPDESCDSNDSNGSEDSEESKDSNPSEYPAEDPVEASVTSIRSRRADVHRYATDCDDPTGCVVET